jgi:TyrR family helix-turn-helix protein
MEHLPRELLKEDIRPRPALSDAEREEAEKIRTLIARYPESRPTAARALGVSRTTLWRKMKKYGISEAGSET